MAMGDRKWAVVVVGGPQLFQQKEQGGPNRILPPKKGDVEYKGRPMLAAEEGNGILAITGRPGGAIKKIAIQSNQGERGGNYEVGIVQILERILKKSKNQMVALDEGGAAELQQSENRADRQWGATRRCF